MDVKEATTTGVKCVALLDVVSFCSLAKLGRHDSLINFRQHP